MSLYSNVVIASKPFLGPATEKFLERQCKYLKVEPNQLAKEHLEQLAWLSNNAARLIMYSVQADKLAEKIKSL
jgi:hypothetical protein